MNTTTDWFTTERIGDGITQISEGAPVLPCNSYLIDGGTESLLIDTGLGIGDLRGLVDTLTAGTIRVFLTHAHWDHLGAGHQFDDVTINPRERHPDGSVTLDVLQDKYDHRPREFITSWIDEGHPLPDGFDGDAYGIKPIHDVAALEPGDHVVVGNRAVELIPIPGHTPGQTAVLDTQSSTCFAADVLEPGYQIYAHFDDANLEPYLATFDRLIALRDTDQFDTLAISHGQPIKGHELAILDNARTALERVIEGTPDYDLIQTPWGATREYTFTEISVLTQHT